MATPYLTLRNAQPSLFAVSTLTGSTLSIQNLSTTGGKAIMVRQTANPTRYIELGADSANTSYIDFHSQDNVEVDYSTRIQSLAGSTIGGGALMIYGSSIGINTSAMTSNFQLSTTMTADLGGALKTQFTDTEITAGILAQASTIIGTITGPTAGVYTFTTNATYGYFISTLKLQSGPYYRISITASSTSSGITFSIGDNTAVTPIYWTSPTLTSTMTTYTFIIKSTSPTLAVGIPGPSGSILSWNAFSIQRMDTIPPALGYGAMTFGSNDSGITAATLATSQWQGALSGPTSGVYTFTINSSQGSTGSAAAFNQIPIGTILTVTFTAKSTSNPTTWGIQSSNGIWWYGPTLTTTMTQYSFTLPTNGIFTTLYFALTGSVGNNIQWDSFNVKLTNGGNAIVNGNVGIGVTTPTTANLQLAQGLTADLGGALKTQWTDMGLSVNSTFTGGYNTASLTLSNGVLTHTLGSGDTNGTFSSSVNLVVGATYNFSWTVKSSSATADVYFYGANQSSPYKFVVTSSYAVYTYQFVCVNPNFTFRPYVGASGSLSISAILIQRLDTVATGNVGIGTTTPSSQLEIYRTGAGQNTQLNLTSFAGGATTTNVATLDLKIQGAGGGMVDNTIVGTYIGSGIGSGAGQGYGFNLNTGGNATMTICGTGAYNVTRLQANNAVSAISQLVFDNSLSIYWHQNGYGNNPTTVARGAAYGAGMIQCGNESGNYYEDGYLSFHTCRDLHTDGTGGLGVLSEKMRITSLGNVGIGTSAPIARLTLYGSMYANYSHDGTNIGPAYKLIGQDSGISDVGIYISKKDSSAGFPSDNAYIFQTVANGNPKMTQSYSGNVGIGTTTPASKFVVYDYDGGTGDIKYVSAVFPSTYTIGDPVAKLRLGWYSDYWDMNACRSGSTPIDQLTFTVNGGTPRFSVDTNGNIYANGTVNGTAKNFIIPHPVQPTEKKLVHASVEGPRMDLLYRGSVALQAGQAIVNMNTDSTSSPECGMSAGTFEALCRNPVFYLQNMDGFARVKGHIQGAVLTIIAEDPTCIDTVSWMVVAERKDPYVIQAGHTTEDGCLITEMAVEPVSSTEPSSSV